MVTVLLDTLSLDMIPKGSYVITIKVTLSHIRVHDNIRCYIRHEGIIRLLRKELGVELKPSAELYQYSPEDDVYMVIPRRGKEGKEELGRSDVDVFKIIITGKVVER